MQAKTHPPTLPTWAANVTEIVPGFWLGEFNGGAVVELAFDTIPFNPRMVLHVDMLEGLLNHLVQHQDRYRAAIAADRRRQQGYEDYLAEAEYRDEDED